MSGISRRVPEGRLRTAGTADDLLRQGLCDLGIVFSEEQVLSFIAYLSELKKWNRAHSLTGLKTDSEIVIKHFLDSLLFERVLPGDVLSLADVGSGAGFPGIPIAIMRPTISVSLIEPVSKKAVFLRHICHILGLGRCSVIEKRVEKITGLVVDAAVTRALYRAKDFAEKTRGIVREGGILVLSKGPGVGRELQELSGTEVTRIDLRLPFLDVVRHLIVVRP